MPRSSPTRRPELRTAAARRAGRRRRPRAFARPGRRAVELCFLGWLSAACSESAVEVQEAAAPPAPAEAPGGPSGEAVEPELRKSPDGLVVRILEPGRGPRAVAGRRVLLHYRGTLAESGEEFITTLRHGIPDELTLGSSHLIPGLERALTGLAEGTRADVHVPASLAYGDSGLGVIPPGADLRFEIDLVGVR